MEEFRRWTLAEGVVFDGEWAIVGPDPQPNERVVVVEAKAYDVLLRQLYAQGNVYDAWVQRASMYEAAIKDALASGDMSGLQQALHTGPFVTKTGRVLDDADFERLADEAEAAE
jgi:hypothetical protein